MKAKFLLQALKWKINLKKDLTKRNTCDKIRLAAIENRICWICWCGSMAEQLICNQQVVGSTPITSSIYGGFPEWPKGTDCKSAGDAFGGPNPPSPTKKKKSRQRLFFLYSSLFSFLFSLRSPRDFFRRKVKREKWKEKVRFAPQNDRIIIAIFIFCFLWKAVDKDLHIWYNIKK